jgi:hypothetical protein
MGAENTHRKFCRASHIFMQEATSLLRASRSLQVTEFRAARKGRVAQRAGDRTDRCAL